MDVMSRLHEAAGDGKLENLRELKVGTAVTVPDISLPNMVSARLVRATVVASRKIDDLVEFEKGDRMFLCLHASGFEARLAGIPVASLHLAPKYLF